MSTKTTFKRVALVTVAALGFGVLSTVVPAQAAVGTALTVAVGPNGATSLTVVGGETNTTGALIRFDVTNDETSTAGLGSGDTIIGSVTAVPSLVVAKTLAANGNGLNDTSALPGSGKSDFVMLESRNQTAGVPNTTAALTTSIDTNWTTMAGAAPFTGLATTGATAVLDTATVSSAAATDGSINASNTGYVNKDTVHQLTTAQYTKSYYATIRPRVGADVIDKGAYTFSFQLTNSTGMVISTKTVKIDFVSTAAKSDAAVTLTPTGTFLVGGTLAAYDSATADSYVSLTLRNRDGGLVRNNLGGNEVPSARIQWSRTANPGYVDTATLTVNDSGTLGTDFGSDVYSNGNGTMVGQDGVYSVTGTLPSLATDAVSTTAAIAYRWWLVTETQHS